jgi:hypothetical protein
VKSKRLRSVIVECTTKFPMQSSFSAVCVCVCVDTIFSQKLIPESKMHTWYQSQSSMKLQEKIKSSADVMSFVQLQKPSLVRGTASEAIAEKVAQKAEQG